MFYDSYFKSARKLPTSRPSLWFSLAYQKFIVSRQSGLWQQKNPLRRQNQLHLSWVFQTCQSLSQCLKRLKPTKRRCGCGHGLGYTPLFGMLFCHPDVWLYLANRQCAFVRRQSAIYHQSCQTKSATAKFRIFTDDQKPYPRCAIGRACDLVGW